MLIASIPFSLNSLYIMIKEMSEKKEICHEKYNIFITLKIVKKSSH